jgi:hypothetical protein
MNHTRFAARRSRILNTGARYSVATEKGVALKVDCQPAINVKIKILDCVIGRRRVKTASSFWPCPIFYLKAYMNSDLTPGFVMSSNAVRTDDLL